MTSSVLTDAVRDARSVGGAADAVARAIRSNGDVESALDQLELQAAHIVGDSVQGFDADGVEPSDEELLAIAVSQLGIGTTLLCTEAAAAPTAGGSVAELQSAVTTLERTADALEEHGAAAPLEQGFDTRPGGSPLPVADAALAALDEMADAAGDVATAILDRTLKPLVDRVPAPLKDIGTQLGLDIPGRLARWGLRAVRKGLDLLLRLVDFEAVERYRERLDAVLTRLGQGEDAAVLSGWAIGVEAVRAEVTAGRPAGVDEALVRELAGLADRFAQLCRLLRRVAGLIAGLAATLALFQITLAHAVGVTALGLVLVLAAMVALGRDYTGASDIPGRVRGVRVLLGLHGHVVT